jgi:two-component system chemotaxis response regulator CheY
VDVDELVAWCSANNLAIDAEARRRFTAGLLHRLRAQSQVVAPAVGVGPRVLVVEDTATMRAFFRLTLKALRTLRVDEAGDGVEALEALHRADYDLVLLDLNLPMVDGLQVLSMLRAREGSDGQVPVVVVSAVRDEKMLDKVRALGVAHILPKPIQAALLIEVVGELLGVARPARRHDGRRAQRLHLPVQIAFADGEPLSGTTWDLSTSGAFIASERIRPIGAVGIAQLEVPHLTMAIDVGCEVVHLRTNPVGFLPTGMGVRFQCVTAEQERVLEAVFTSPSV